MQALYKHQGTELKGVKTALQERDARLDDLEKEVRQDHEEATRSVEAYEMQIQSLKGKGIALRPPLMFLSDVHFPCSDCCRLHVA